MKKYTSIVLSSAAVLTLGTMMANITTQEDNSAHADTTKVVQKNLKQTNSVQSTSPSGIQGTCRWNIDNDGTLTIGAGTLSMTDDQLKAATSPWANYKDLIKTIKFESGVVGTGNLANLFQHFPSLTQIDLNGFETSSVVSMVGMFADNPSLQSLDLKNFNTSSVTLMDGMFTGDTSLRSLDLSSFDTSNVNSMNTMFSNDSGLESLDLSSFDTSNVDMMVDMFKGDNNLSSISVGIKTNIDEDASLPSPVTDSHFTGEWQSLGTGTRHNPNGDWKGSTSNLLKRTQSGVADTYVWRANHDFSFIANDATIEQSAVENSDLVAITNAKLIDKIFPTDKFTISVKDNGGISTKVGDYDVVLTSKEVPFLTKRVKVSVVPDIVEHDYQFTASDITVDSSQVNTLDLVKSSGAKLVDKDHPSDKFTVVVKDSGGLTNKAGTYTVVLGAKEVPDLVKNIKVTVTSEVHDYKFSANNLTVKTSQVSKLDIIKASQAQVIDKAFPNNKFTIQVLNKGGLKSKAGSYTVTLGVKEVPNLVKKITVKVNADTPNPKPSPSVKYHTMYRVYNKNTGEHLYTASAFERDSLVKGGWSNEGIGWQAPTSGTAVYRLYNPNVAGGDHYYTASKFEAQSLVKGGWKWDNGGKPVFYSGGKTKIYVAYNPNAKSGSHNYTSSAYEQKTLLANGWKYGKVQFYGK